MDRQRKFKLKVLKKNIGNIKFETFIDNDLKTLH